MESLLVTVEDLRKYTTISKNIDCEMLEPFLLLAQQSMIEQILGTSLYDEIITQFDANTLSSANQTLYENYIIPATGWAAFYMGLPFLHMKINRNGINTSGTDTITPVSPEELSVMTIRLNSIKDFYLSRLEKFLVANKIYYPLFRRNNFAEGTGSSIWLGFRTNRIKSPYWDENGIDLNMFNSSDCSGC